MWSTMLLKNQFLGCGQIFFTDDNYAMHILHLQRFNCDHCKYTVQVIHKCCVSVQYFLGWIACDCFFELLQSFNYNPHDKVIQYLFLCKLSSHYVRLPDCQSGLVLILLWLSIGLLLEAWVAYNIISELKIYLVNPVRQISTHLYIFYLYKPFFLYFVFAQIP